MIGITETYDPCFVPDWDKKLLDANIIISKELTNDMIEKLVVNQDKIIFHHTVTGLGETVYEPNVKSWNHEKFQALKLFSKGFPKNHYVLRIDPIIPCDEGLYGLEEVLYAWSMHFCNGLQTKCGHGQLEKMRCRISVIDMYNHVNERFAKAGIEPYFKEFNAPQRVFDAVEYALEKYKDYFDFECCAEPKFKADFIRHIGCASSKDLYILTGLLEGELPEKPQRKTCLCLAKRQILGVKPRRCPHQCLYCFWRD